MTKLKAFLAVAAALSLVSSTAASADPVKNIVLVHGAWVDGSGWKPVYDILRKEGFNVTMVQEPETSFADDVTATKRILDLQDGPTVLVGHSYGGSSITRRACTRMSWASSMLPRTLPTLVRMRENSARRRRAYSPKPPARSRKRRTASPISIPRSFPCCSRQICRASRVSSLRGLANSSGSQRLQDRGRVEGEAELGHSRRQRPNHQS